jgi:hypothetical protein
MANFSTIRKDLP